METKLTRIAQTAKGKPKEKITSLAGLINKENLKETHVGMCKKKASGVDHVTKEEYGKNLDDLLKRMKRQAYKPQPVKRVYIPKAGSNLMGALIMLGLQPGPLMLEKSGDVIWATIAGLMLANVFLLILNTAFVPTFTMLIAKAQPYLAPLVSTLCLVGVYMLEYSFFDVGLSLMFGLMGFFMKKYGFPLPPVVLSFVLGGMIEMNYRQSLLLSHNSFSIFFTRPISLVFMIFTIGVVILPVFKKLISIVRCPGLKG